MLLQNVPPEFKALFWDIHFDTLDIEEHSRFIITRVVTRGTLEDWYLLKKLYNRERMMQEVVQIRSLDKKKLCFLSRYFGLERTKFRCCN
ncbi:DUF6922 domain-containing protein [Desulfogranum marinum]|uniref:DUF6922 domain-containing protein n=1 Tax=Desulfogranum marinum TaxID=453220 RepID=UPI00374C9154